MSAPQFTPGPWERHPYSHGRSTVAMDDGTKFDFASVYFGPGRKIVGSVQLQSGKRGFPQVEDDAELEANAHLVMTAPELYAALESACWLIEDAERDTSWSSGDGYDAESKADEFRRLLAKARGEQ